MSVRASASTNKWAFFDAMIVHQVIKSGYNDPSKSMCWKLFGATLKKTTPGMIIVTSSFFERSVFKMFSVHSKTQKRRFHVPQVGRVLSKMD